MKVLDSNINRDQSYRFRLRRHGTHVVVEWRKPDGFWNHLATACVASSVTEVTITGADVVYDGRVANPPKEIPRSFGMGKGDDGRTTLAPGEHPGLAAATRAMIAREREGK